MTVIAALQCLYRDQCQNQIKQNGLDMIEVTEGYKKSIVFAQSFVINYKTHSQIRLRAELNKSTNTICLR